MFILGRNVCAEGGVGGFGDAGGVAGDCVAGTL